MRRLAVANGHAQRTSRINNGDFLIHFPLTCPLIAHRAPTEHPRILKIAARENECSINQCVTRSGRRDGRPRCTRPGTLHGPPVRPEVSLLFFARRGTTLTHSTQRRWALGRGARVQSRPVERAAPAPRPVPPSSKQYIQRTLSAYIQCLTRLKLQTKLSTSESCKQTSQVECGLNLTFNLSAAAPVLEGLFGSDRWRSTSSKRQAPPEISEVEAGIGFWPRGWRTMQALDL